MFSLDFDSNFPIIPLSPLKSIVLSTNSITHECDGFESVNGNIFSCFCSFPFSESFPVAFSVFIEVFLTDFLSD